MRETKDIKGSKIGDFHQVSKRVTLNDLFCPWLMDENDLE